ncbi:MAG: hypothetical protein WA937_13440 [Flavobacteriales bacterium]
MERVETPSAFVERVSPQLVICRYKHGVKVNAAAVRENLAARMSFPGKEPYAVIGIFPEDVDFDMSLLEQNHYTNIALNLVTQLLAIVAEGALFEPIASLYFAYHPTRFLNKVFPSEAEALAWVEQRIQVLVQLEG